MRRSSFLATIMMTMIVAAVLAGCGTQQATVNNAAEQTSNTVEKAAEQVEKKARPVVKRAGQVLSDSGLTLKVKTALAASDKVDAVSIDVETKNQVVYLRGTVPDAKQKAAAESLAKNTVAAGVKVVNQLQVLVPAKSATAKPTPAKS